MRVLAGLALTAAGIAVLVEASRSGSSGPDDTRPAAIPLLLGAAALLAPLLVTPFAAVLDMPLRLFGGASGSLARANLRSDRGRVAAVATPVMVAAGLVVTFVGAKLDIQHRTIAQAEARTSATDVLAPRGSSTALPPGLAAAAARVPGVERVSGTFATSLVVAVGGNPRVAPARAVEAATLAGVLDPGVTGGSLAGLTGTTVAVADETARQFGWHVGDRVSAWLGDGTPARLTVVATFARPLGFATVLLPRPLASRHATSAVDDLAFVLRRGPAARTELRSLAAQSGQAQLRSRSAYLDDVRGVTAKQALPVFLVLGLIAAFCAVGAVNSLTMAIGGRTHELAVLRQVGATRRQLARMVRAEAAVTVGFGLAVGALVAVPAPQPPLWLYGLLTAGFAALMMVACVAPTRLALRSGAGGPLPD